MFRDLAGVPSEAAQCRFCMAGHKGRSHTYLTWQQILGLGLTGTLIAACTGGFNDPSRRSFELQRRRAEFYLLPKLEALRNLHAALGRSHFEINRRGKGRMPQNDQEFRDLLERQEM